jgi:hydrogenase maturation protease
MPETTPTKPVLVFTYGNPSRGDDALGPALYEQLDQRQRTGEHFADVEFLTDFQLQVEHALDLRARHWVLFVDASQTAQPPFEFYRLSPAREVAHTTHAMSPAAVLAVYQQVFAIAPPPAFMLSIRGYQYGLGQPLSTQARRHLDEALTFVAGMPIAPPFDIDNFAEQYCPRAWSTQLKS